jgi:hypothetical protein
MTAKQPKTFKHAIKQGKNNTIREIADHTIGNKYRSKRFALTTCDTCPSNNWIAEEKRWGCTQYDGCRAGGKDDKRFILKSSRATKPTIRKKVR